MMTARMVVVDASVWVARLVPQDTFHQPARDWMAACRAANTFLVAPSLMLVEVVGAIARRTGDHDLALRTLDSLPRLPGLRLVEMENALVIEAATLAASLGLRGADAMYVATAATLDLPLCTLDEEQARRAANKVEIQSLIVPGGE
jgi:predicted nucleic acid-binding protein